MPIISQFYGIIIRVYFNDTEKHYLEHIAFFICTMIEGANANP